MKINSKLPVMIIHDEIVALKDLSATQYEEFHSLTQAYRRIEALSIAYAFKMMEEHTKHTKHPQKKGGDNMDIKLVTKDDKVIAIQNEGVTIVRLGADDLLIEEDEGLAIIETTAKSKGIVVGTDRFTVALDIPEVRANQLELLELAAAQAKVRCKNAVRAPGGGLSSVQKSILTALKESDPEAFAVLLASAEAGANHIEEGPDVDEEAVD